MAVVIRLQGLRVTAGTEDIRRFFTGLKIPDGGVHIIGGEREEAFIIFASDEDARRAMTRSGGVIKGAPVSLLLSSKTEMQAVLERSTRNAELEQKRRLEENTRSARRSADPEGGRRSGSRSRFTPPAQRASNDNDFMCLFLKGLPFNVTEKEITDFFGGLHVVEIVILKNRDGSSTGNGLIRFATRDDAAGGLERDRKFIRSRYIEVSPTTINDWCRAAGRPPMAANRNDDFERGRSPLRNQRNPPHRVRSRSPLSKRHIAPSDNEYCVMLENLSFAVEKEHIKHLFHNAKLEDDQILQLSDGDGRRSRCAFVLFKSQRDYCEALSVEKRQFLNRLVCTRPISRENMISILESQTVAARPPGNPERFQERPPHYPSAPYDSEKTCLFMQNLPFDVRKVEIMDFFHEFTVAQVCVLHDHKGAGVGKALVLFGSEAEADRALSLDGRRFLGSEVALKCISRSQMEQLSAEPPVVQEPREERYSGRSSEASFPPGDTLYSDFRGPHDHGATDGQGSFHGGYDYEPHAVDSYSPPDRGNGVGGSFGPPVQHFDGPTCVQLLNLPFQIRSEEIYDFCYGYRMIPGSVSLQYEPSGRPKGQATLVFETRQEALTAIRELSGRPIGPRKIQLLLV